MATLQPTRDRLVSELAWTELQVSRLQGEALAQAKAVIIILRRRIRWYTGRIERLQGFSQAEA